MNSQIKTILILSIIVVILGITLAIIVVTSPSRTEIVENTNMISSENSSNETTPAEYEISDNANSILSLLLTVFAFLTVYGLVISIVFLAITVIIYIGIYKLYKEIDETCAKIIIVAIITSVVSSIFTYLTVPVIIAVSSGISGILLLVLLWKLASAVGLPTIPLLIIIPLCIFGIGLIGILVYNIIINIRIGKQFGKSTGFIIGLVLLSPIFESILGYQLSGQTK